MLTSSYLQISALIGILLPGVVAFVQQQHWSASTRTVIGVAASLVAAVVQAVAQHKLNWHDWAASAIVIFTLTKTTYLAVWKPTGIAPRIEKATSTQPPITP